MWKAVLGRWSIALLKYFFQAPANRIGFYEFSMAQLKTIQEAITLAVFAISPATYLGERLKRNHMAGFACIYLAVFFVLHKW